jgi:hypothetical protein
MRLYGLLAGLLLVIILSACTGASLSQTGVGLMSPTSSNSQAAAAPTAESLTSQSDPTQASPASSTNSPANELANKPATEAPTENGLTIQIDPALASGDTIQVIPAVAATADSPYWTAAPEFRQMTLNGYPVAEHAFQPQIFVYPVEDFKSANPAAAQMINSLQALLASPQEIQDMPFLPLFNAKQMMHTHLQYLDFQNGKGLRYLTQFSQGIVPANNRELIYTYQGLTDDGKYYVAAVLPVTHPSLPADEKLTEAELEKLASDYPQYLADLAGNLNQQPANSFSPDLTQLDAMMSSVEVR